MIILISRRFHQANWDPVVLEKLEMFNEGRYYVILQLLLAVRDCVKPEGAGHKAFKKKSQGKNEVEVDFITTWVTIGGRDPIDK